MVPSFDAQVRRKDGVTFPVTLHISPLRDVSGELPAWWPLPGIRAPRCTGEQAQRESQERYRDLSRTPAR